MKFYHNYFYMVGLFFLSVFTVTLGQNFNKPKGFGIEFNKGMEPCYEYKKIFPQTNIQWKKIKQLYDKHVFNSVKYDQKNSIPKIVHHVWLGSPLPELYKTFRESWVNKHPGWTFILWTDNPKNHSEGTYLHGIAEFKELARTNQVAGQLFVIDIKNVALYNRHAYESSKNFGERADIVRYEALYELGGMYVDTDFECLQPFDYFMHTLDFFASVAYSATPEIFIALIGTRPGHPILEGAVKNLQKSFATHDDTLSRTGNYHFTRTFFEQLNYVNDRMVLFPVTYFYPWPNHKREQNSPTQIKQWIKPESCALHYWEISWGKPAAFVKQLNRLNDARRLGRFI